MPLIRAIGRFFGRRMRVSEPHRDFARVEAHSDLGGIYGSTSGMAGAAVWLLLVVVGLPLILFMVLVGVIYEGIIRIDVRRILPTAAHWAASLVMATLVSVGIAIFVANNVLPAIAL